MLSTECRLGFLVAIGALCGCLLAGRVLLLVAIYAGSGRGGWIMESGLQLRRYRRSRRLGVAIAALFGRGLRGLLRFRRMVALGAFADLDVCRVIKGYRAIWRRKNYGRRRLRGLS